MTYANIFSNPILITGGAGFLGSHMVALCLEKKVDVVVIDNLSNSDLSNLQKLESHFNVKIPFYQIDIRHQNKLKKLFDEHRFSAVIHFAGLKSVSESVDNPCLYHDNNVIGSQNVIDCIKRQGIKNVIFSSSATVYGDPQFLPIDEEHPVSPVNPYGQSKADVEQLFLDEEFFKSTSTKILRYFNPIGSYKGIIYENPNTTPSNLLPIIVRVANGQDNQLNIYGNDYETSDGTGVRDYIHVLDLVEAHWASLQDTSLGCTIYNVGRGSGVSVMEIVNVFESVNKISIPKTYKPRRKGDVAICYAEVSKINKRLNWKAKKNLSDMCRDAWKKNNVK